MPNASHTEITKKTSASQLRTALPNGRKNKQQLRISSLHHQRRSISKHAAIHAGSSRCRIVTHRAEVMVLATARFHRPTDPVQEPAFAHRRLAERPAKAPQATGLALDARNRVVVCVLALDRPLLPKVRNRLHSRERLQGLRVAERPRIAKLHIERNADECNPWVVWLRLGEGVLGARFRARLASCPPLECLRCMGWHLVRAAVLRPELEDHLGRSKGEHHWRSRRRPRAKR